MVPTWIRMDRRRSFSSALCEQEHAGSLDVTAGVNALDALKLSGEAATTTSLTFFCAQFLEPHLVKAATLTL